MNRKEQEALGFFILIVVGFILYQIYLVLVSIPVEVYVGGAILIVVIGLVYLREVGVKNNKESALRRKENLTKRLFEEQEKAKKFEEELSSNDNLREANLNAYNTKKHKTKKELFEENRKERYKNFLKETKNKGTEFELKTGEYFKEQGYKVFYNGINKGVKDQKVDVVAHKDNETLLIQCKNWKEDGKFKITVKEIEDFIKGCSNYLAYHKQLQQKDIKKVYCCSSDIYTKESIEFALQHNVETLVV